MSALSQSVIALIITTISANDGTYRESFEGLLVGSLGQHSVTGMLQYVSLDLTLYNSSVSRKGEWGAANVTYVLPPKVLRLASICNWSRVSYAYGTR